jgi:hypothetical protein
MITIIVEALWLRLHAVLGVFADRLAEADPTLIRDLGRTANDAFLLRGYLALRRHAGGAEVAITIDVRGDDRQLTIESDACTDEGEVIAAGPSAVIPLVDSQPKIEAAIGDWLRAFERFLQEKEPAVATAASKLT